VPLDTGEIVGDRYRVVRLLGQGGMGAVYRAWDTRLNRPVALKEMIPQAGLDVGMLAQLREQFEQEAQTLATLTHPGLVRVTDYFSWNDNEYLVMDFVEGESLADRIFREGARPEAQVLTWAGQLLDALAYCHRKGVIHRDIKPQNIIITPEGEALLVDFGLVKLWNPQDPQTRTVMRGAGTPEYAPPEQYDIGMGHTDPRSDIYSLGATLYQALTGQVPPTATQRMASPTSFLPPRRINAAVTQNTESAVLKALEMAMERRFQSADEMAQGLREPSLTAVITLARAPVESGQAMAAAEAAMEPSAPARRGPSFLLGGVSLIAVGMLCLVLAIGAVLAGLYVLGKNGGDGKALATPTSSLGAPSPPSATEASNLIFQDDFGSPVSGWEVGEYETGDVGYKDGVYFVTSISNTNVMWGVANRTFDNSIIEVDATQISAGPESDNSYGVVCREQGDGDGYYLRVSGDGYYSIAKAIGDDFEYLVDWTESGTIRQGNATNHIRAVCDGSRFELFVNGELLAAADDSTFATGDIALTATTYEDDATEVHFDDLVVYAP
jgi:tRNA A-37 threonylcarbamoyl transferase component Bud32